MSPSLLPLKKRTARILKITWSLTALVALFILENILLDPLLHKKFPRWPSLIPPPPSPAWLIIFSIVSIFLAVLLVCLVFVLRHPGIRSRRKLQTGIALSLTVFLFLFWLHRTGGSAAEAIAQAASAQNGNLPGGHWANLTWRPSSSIVVGYNVYRSDVSGSGYIRLNATPVRELSYLDSSVEPGKTYFYIVKAVNAGGVESAASNETPATIPKK